ncbi:ParB N-terminal domain-containing protein [Serratia marcescens]|uniref:ParB N-terminal domain-containing protein n=1 Tax=Serratia nevei TaxID=2703794 RepID=UPI002937CF3D|nr:ParB N-terminal domain-containing protein [Serratia marcescens]ELQ9441956.1 ParB N-terminal domain-containing protein [Serratia marcescens]ELT5562482.1 ParB N-terminal domain-containing protein [Serratia marcescens]
MSRMHFTQQKDIPIENILLDTGNARIRAGSDQNNCISRILRKEKQLLVLMEDIAENGLTTMPILVMPTNDEKWIVKDGNRRVTALKLLNDPNLCSEPHLISKIKEIKKKHSSNIPSKIDCLSSDNKDAIFKEIVARHSGARDGAGQYDWHAYMRTVFLLNNEHPTDYKRAGQYLILAEQGGLDIEDDFPITTVHRFFTIANLKLLGYEVENDKLKPILSQDKIIKMASKINTDFSQKIVDVNSVFTPEAASMYLRKVREFAGIFEYEDSSNEKNENQGEPEGKDTNSDSDDAGDSSSNNTSNTENPDNINTTDDVKSPSSGRGRTPKKRPSERNKIFGRGKVGIPVPDDDVKVRTIIAELRQLDVKKTTLAVTFLLRALLELSEKEYRGLNKLKDKSSLSKNIATCADHMLAKGLIDDSEHNVIMSYTRGEQGALHIETLQKLIHRDTHHPDYITINTFWDNIGCFVRACWKD